MGIRHLRLEGERFERARTGFEQVHRLALCGPAPREVHAMHALEGVLLDVWGDSERLKSPFPGLSAQFAFSRPISRSRFHSSN
ncbi:MAG: hypothetical protein H7095_06585 [Pseudopedobacter sp.]|nr:hypothetical protein [Deinococcales bacterium]